MAFVIRYFGNGGGAMDGRHSMHRRSRVLRLGASNSWAQLEWNHHVEFINIQLDFLKPNVELSSCANAVFGKKTSVSEGLFSRPIRTSGVAEVDTTVIIASPEWTAPLRTRHR